MDYIEGKKDDDNYYVILKDRFMERKVYLYAALWVNAYYMYA